MREKFWGYFPLTKDEFKAIWNESYIILDTNILLNLYRYSKSTQEILLENLEKKKDKLVLHEIVLKEFFRNRYSVINEHCKVIEDLSEKFKKIGLNQIKSDINSFRHTNLNKENLINIIEEFEEKINEELKKCEIINFLDEDPILNKITSLFGENFILDFKDTVKDDESKIAYDRYNKKIPPGYMDLDKSTENKGNFEKDEYGKYNDYFIWKQIINFAKDEKTNIIFVTDDAKEDWFRKNRGKTLGPREELLNEFYKETGKMIYIYNTQSFLREINNNGDELSEEMLNEIAEITVFSDYKKQKWSASDLIKFISFLGSNIKYDSDSDKSNKITNNQEYDECEYKKIISQIFENEIKDNMKKQILEDNRGLRYEWNIGDKIEKIYLQEKDIDKDCYMKHDDNI